MIQIKRIYDPPQPSDGYRILVDRLWPRGVSKSRAQLDEWLKGVAPSPDLRQWFNHEADKFAEFSHRYRDELDHNSASQQLISLVKQNSAITLLYGAKDPAINHAAVLKDYLIKKAGLKK